MWRDYLPQRRKYRTRGSDSTNRAKLIAKLMKIAFVLVIIGIIVLLISVPLIARELPSPDKVVRRDGFSTKILDRKGQVLYDVYSDQNRTLVDLKNVPTYLKQGTIAIEDKNFYKNNGFDFTGILRGFLSTLFRGRLAGGSTLTQQLVKNSLLTQDRTLIRKFKEFVLTIEVDSRFTKDQILQMYLNEVPYGGTAWGVEAASEMYFGKKVSDLNLIECAFIAGLPQSPSYYSPYTGSTKAYEGRTKDVLRRMREDGYITAAQEKEAVNQVGNLSFQTLGAGFKAPHFVQYVEKIIEDKYGASALQGGGLQITTTLDLAIQEEVQNIVSDEISKVESIHITNGAAVVIDPQNGEILAMVGSKDFHAKDYDGQYNVAVALRQPGSAIKPFTYVAAFKKGYTPSTMVMDVPTTFPGGDQKDYKPVNYDGKYRGPVQLRFALANSINVPAVKVLAMVGIRDALQVAYNAGLRTLEPTQKNLDRLGLSMTLGGGEVTLLDLTDAYSIFMNGGYKVSPASILKVVDHNGKVLEENKPQKGNSVVSQEQAYLIADILSDNNARKDVFGLNSLLNVPGKTVAVKTGTTNDKRDNWAIGGNANGLVGVWVGNNDNSPMVQVASGVSGASPIWSRIIQRILKDKPNTKFQAPSGIVKEEVDVISGYRAHDNWASRSESFVKGTEPTGEDPIHRNLKVCKSDGKLATPSDIAANNYDNKEFYVFKEEDPTAGPGGENKWQKGILEWLTTQTDSKYHPPTDFCGTTNPMNVDFQTPRDQDGNLNSSFDIKISANSTSNIKEVSIEIDGTRVATLNNLPYQYSASGISNGIHTIRAIGEDDKGYRSDRTITVGVGVPYSSPSPTPTP